MIYLVAYLCIGIILEARQDQFLHPGIPHVFDVYCGRKETFVSVVFSDTYRVPN
jgi:hypothetical protein